MRITHIVVTDAFAGTERYVAEVARRQAAVGQDVRVLGGDSERMRAEVDGLRHDSAGSMSQALDALRRGGRRDVVHAHLTAAESAAVAAWPWHRARIVATRHIAQRRGSSRVGRIVAPTIRRALTAEIAISAYVAGALGNAPDVILPNGVATSELPYEPLSRTVLLLQRLEAEKDTETAIRAWCASGLADAGWELHIAGAGGQRGHLEALAAESRAVGIRFLGPVSDPGHHLGRSAALLATAIAEPLGLSVLESMAAGRPVLAAAAGGHLETLPPDWPWFFPPRDAQVLADLLVTMAADARRRQELGEQLRRRQRELFSLGGHVRRLQEVYDAAML